ncbi:MAG: RnfABCDGE type electron transport complex subunit D [Bdellovibrionales bacterium]|nr:RnfABCDGE type electron transport complex subunit D [Bdellovibrionales bacterium]
MSTASIREINQSLRMLDARVFQILSLFFLLCAGLSSWNFVIEWKQAVLCFASALFTQAMFQVIEFHRFPDGKKPFNWMSPWITSSSLLLLLKSTTIWVHPFAAFVAISSKFFFRIKGKHFFNPANFAIVISLMLLPAWISPGQWGRTPLLIFFALSAGAAVTSRARTTRVSAYFLTFFSLMLLCRVLYLEYELSIWTHQISNGVILIFAFFMISDPKTSPYSTFGIILHTLLVSILSMYFIFFKYEPNALMYSLFMLSPVVALFHYFKPNIKHA